MSKSFIISIFLIFILTTSLNSRLQKNYTSAKSLSVSVFRNFYGFIEWKKDFFESHQKRYHTIQLKNYDDLVLKLNQKIQKEIDYIKNLPDKDNYSNMYIPAIFINDNRQLPEKFQIYYNGTIVSPKKVESIGKFSIHYYKKVKKNKIIKSYQSYKLVLFTFPDTIYNQNVVLSIKNEFDIDHGFNVGKGLIPKSLFE